MDQQSIVELLHEQKFRLTQERQALLELFVSTEKMYTPAEWHEVARNHGVRVGLTTVYRLLEVVTKVGLASPFLMDGNIYYTFCSGNHHHHFICLDCHKVLDLYECPAFESVPEGCTVTDHRVDLFGTCARCQGDAH